MTISRTQSTHFGYQKVSAQEKVARVNEVFSSVAQRYDFMNDLMSFAMHRLWKRFAYFFSGVRAGSRVLDVAGGSGDLTRLFARQVTDRGQVVLLDVNSDMLHTGREKLINAGCVTNVAYVQADAQNLPFANDWFDCVSIAFGLRNVVDKAAALRSMYRVLKPGGSLIVLEFSQLTVESLQPLYDMYSFYILPLLGKIVLDDAPSYRYLAESIRMHPNQETLKRMILEAGFADCQYYNLAAGIVALHKAYKY